MRTDTHASCTYTYTNIRTQTRHTTPTLHIKRVWVAKLISSMISYLIHLRVAQIFVAVISCVTLCKAMQEFPERIPCVSFCQWTDRQDISCKRGPDVEVEAHFETAYDTSTIEGLFAPRSTGLSFVRRCSIAARQLAGPHGGIEGVKLQSTSSAHCSSRACWSFGMLELGAFCFNNKERRDFMLELGAFLVKTRLFNRRDLSKSNHLPGG